MTEDEIKQRRGCHVAKAKAELEQIGPETDSDSSKFVPTAIMVLPNGSEKELPLRFIGNVEKQQVIQKVAEYCKLVQAQALILRMAISGIKQEIIRQEILSPTDDLNDPEVRRDLEKRTKEWVRKKTGGTRIGRLPDEYRLDAVFVAIIGPNIEGEFQVIGYSWKAGKIVYETPISGPCNLEGAMVPRWWEDR